jgi:hypothetical protein
VSEETPTEAGGGGFKDGDKVVTTEAVNLRSEAALDENNVLMQLDAGTPLTVTGETVPADDIDWVPVVTADDESGYVAAQYLEPAS